MKLKKIKIFIILQFIAPYKKDVITISIFGSSLGTMYPGKGFDKVYQVTVN